MQFKWITDGQVKIIAIVGTSKNAGKTSLLNHLLWRNQELAFGVFSTGIDGEKEDAIFLKPKPAVQLYAGTLFCCDSNALRDLGSRVEILASLAEPGRELFIAKSLGLIKSMITGPATASAQVELAQRMLDLGADKVLVDGSLDRKSIALSPKIDAIALVLGASFGNLNELELELKRLSALRSLSVYAADAQSFALLEPAEELKFFDGTLWQDSGCASLNADPQTLIKAAQAQKELKGIYIPGSVTPKSISTLYSMLPKAEALVLVRHPDCLKLNVHQLLELESRHNLKCLIPFKIKEYILNSEAMGHKCQDADLFRLRLRTAFPELNLIDIMEVNRAG